ncbi:MAG: TRAM domain-containing protein, partial [Negativicutes bacterium]|nr:TRAM domain-containing protein [Negativicutes bacterium]
MKAGDRVTAVPVCGVTHSGEGVGRIGSLTVFVPAALPGEIVDIRIDKVKKKYAVATAYNWQKSAAGRVFPPCRLAGLCGGCQFQHIDYHGQLAIKQQIVADAITHIGRMATLPVAPIIPSPHIWRYRNKMQMPVGWDGGEVAVGFYAHSSHRIIDCRDCLLPPETAGLWAGFVRSSAVRHRYSTYDEETGRGWLRHIVCRTN